VETGEISQELADKHPFLSLTGLVGSIDNDMFGTDMTIGADTALHRITEAVDAITSTASSHQRSFVIEVMGRNCGYLALMSAIATGANWVFIPEFPPESDDWEQEMCDILHTGRDQGRRASIVIVAEGARDRNGNPITSSYVKQVLEDRIGEDTRVTVLGHVQRGGAPSAFERYMSTMVGYSAVIEALAAKPGRDPQVIGIREHRIVRSPLEESINKTRQVAQYIKENNFAEAMRLLGESGNLHRELYLITDFSSSGWDDLGNFFMGGILGSAVGALAGTMLAAQFGIVGICAGALLGALAGGKLTGAFDSAKGDPDVPSTTILGSAPTKAADLSTLHEGYLRTQAALRQAIAGGSPADVTAAQQAYQRAQRDFFAARSAAVGR